MIKEIHNNPFRILGVFSNSAMRDVIANEGKIKAFLKVGKAISYPLDLTSFLPPIERDEKALAFAKSQLSLPNDKVKYAQFWFIKSTPIDDVAFSHLKNGDLDGAIELFKKKRSASSLQNLVVCHLIKGNYLDAILTAEDMYSEFSEDFIKEVDQLSSANKINLINHFVDSLISSGVDLSSIKVSPFDSDWISAINSKVSKLIIDKLKTALDTAKATSGKDGKTRLKAGIKLVTVIKSELPKIKKIVNRMQYQSLADEHANEVLQCGIDYFNESDDIDAAYKALPLQKFATKIAVGSITKDRCKENLDILQKFIAKLPPKEVMAEVKTIRNELDKFRKEFLIKNIGDSICLLQNTKSDIQSIKNKLGATNSFYLKISTHVASEALNNMIEVLNKKMNKMDRVTLFDSVIQDAFYVTLLIDEFDLEEDFKLIYNTNKSSLYSLFRQFIPPTSIPSSCSTTSKTSSRSRSCSSYVPKAFGSSSSNSSSSSGCMVVAIIGFVFSLISLAI